MRYDFADLTLDMKARQLKRGECVVHLSPKAMDLLAILLSNAHRVVPKGELYDQLWPATFVVDGNLPVLISEIRGALGDREHQIIRTVHGTGYSVAIAVHDDGAASRRVNEDEPAGMVHALFYGDREFLLDQGQNLIGREPTARLVLASASVSRRHAIMNVAGDSATLVDLASKNGTFIGTEPLRDEARVADGTILRFGSVKVLYRCCVPTGPTETMPDL